MDGFSDTEAVADQYIRAGPRGRFAGQREYPVRRRGWNPWVLGTGGVIVGAMLLFAVAGAICAFIHVSDECHCSPNNPNNPSCCNGYWNKIRASVTPSNNGSTFDLPFTSQLVSNGLAYTELDIEEILVDTHSIVNVTTNTFTIPYNGTFQLAATVLWFDDVDNVTDAAAPGIVQSDFYVTRGVNTSILIGSGVNYLLQDGPVSTASEVFYNFVQTDVFAVYPLVAGDIVFLALTFGSTALGAGLGAYAVGGLNETALVNAGNLTSAVISSVSVTEL